VLKLFSNTSTLLAAEHWFRIVSDPTPLSLKLLPASRTNHGQHNCWFVVQPRVLRSAGDNDVLRRVVEFVLIVVMS